jgi:16S rRNA (uracil1498-N3)-methyltransferase
MAYADVHEFAVFVPELPLVSGTTNSNQLTLSEPTLIHRLTHILRLEPNDIVIFFDSEKSARTQLLHIIPKKSITTRILSAETHKQLIPQITWFLPLLERAAFQEALYNAAALGITTIQPLITRKVPSNRAAYLHKDTERLNRIMIAAAEQSKQFILPIIKPLIDIKLLPNLLIDAYKNIPVRVFFDSQGETAYQVMSRIRILAPQHSICMSGPEGDLTTEEKDILHKHNFIFCALTPTILRAETAVTIGIGIIRSLVRL